MKATWDKKLKEAGFRDVEDSKGNLKDFHNSLFTYEDFNVDQYLTKQRYYELCSQLLYSFPFKSLVDRIVWQYHCEGRGVRYIAKKTGRPMSEVIDLIREVDDHVRL